MAAPADLRPDVGRRLVAMMVLQTSLLQLCLVAMAIAERCTRAVPSVQEYPAKKVHVLRRIPAECSNWDKAWSWLTKVDCGTKYRLDYVTVPPREVKQYKLQYVCCDGDTDCREADNLHASGFNSTDEKFLAIVLGSTAACLVVLVIVVILVIQVITFYTKKKRCHPCYPKGHEYASAEPDEAADGNRDKALLEEADSEAENKCGEVEYAEINDPRLPRYTDIFKEHPGVREDPFNRATAPPLYTAATTENNYVNSAGADQLVSQNGTRNQVHNKDFSNCTRNQVDNKDFSNCTRNQVHSKDFSNCIALNDAIEEVLEDTRHQSASNKVSGHSGAECQDDYYNLSDNRRKRARTSNKRAVSANGSHSEEFQEDREHMANPVGLKEGQNSAPIHVELLPKSSSASDHIYRVAETSSIKQKRSSAPPDSIDASLLSTQEYASSRSVTAASRNRHTDSNLELSSAINSCNGAKVRNATGRTSKFRDRRCSSEDHACSKEHNHVSQTNTYNSLTKPLNKESHISYLDNNSVFHNRKLSSELHNSSLIQQKQKDVLVKEQPPREAGSSPESGWHCPRTSPGCSCAACLGSDPCSQYDRLESPPDESSLHIYQCLEELRGQPDGLRSGSCEAEISELATVSSGVLSDQMYIKSKGQGRRHDAVGEGHTKGRRGHPQPSC